MTTNQQYALVSKTDPIEIDCSESPPPNVREQVTQIFESYASLYPNPNLAQENEERDKLLRAAYAADHALRVNPKKKKRRWGWFGGRTREEEEGAHQKVVVLEDDDRLQYTEAVDDSNWLLGTEFSLDVSNIPEEAYAVARKQLCGARPNVVRHCWEAKGVTTLLITSLGEFVEFRDNQRTVQYTADRDQLLHFAETIQEDPTAIVSCARAATIGPNFLSVSWGFKQDGHVIFYRRLEATGNVVWEPVGVFEPTKAVQESLFDLFLDEDSHMSALLSVSDVTPLVVEFPDQAPAATLAVARLGGFLELVPLPPKMWYGPPIQPPKRHKHRSGEHFAARLPSVMGGVLVLTTADYHTDVVGLESFRTSVDPDNSEWDQQLYPHSHPAEHVLAAFGGKDGSQIITFWSVSTLIDEKGISLSANLMEALDMGKLGPDVSVFANPSILRHWRKPRQVELRMDSERAEKKAAPVTTLSVPAPIIGLHFLAENAKVQAALLDYNGGVTCLDCGLLERAASQTLSTEEHHLLYQNHEEVANIQLVKISCSRSEIRQSLSCAADTMPPIVSSLQWFCFDSIQNGPGLAVVTTSPLKLRFLFPFAESGFRRTIVPCSDFDCGTLLKFENSNALQVVLQGSQIIFCSIQELSPSDIVQSLVRSSQFREAIVAAERLTSTEQDSISAVIEDCKKNVWELEHDYDVLKSIKDDAFIVRETMIVEESKGSGVVLKGDFDLFRSVGYLALERTKTARLGSSLSIASSISEVNAISNKIKNAILFLGTYEILCSYLSFEPTMEHFFGEFLSVSTVDLAISLAKQCKMEALSVLWCRHWWCIMHKFYLVLDELPLSLHPEVYQHLLPVTEEGNVGALAPIFLSGVSGANDVFNDLAILPDYVETLYNTNVSIDIRDRELLIEKYDLAADNGLSSDGRESLSIDEWYARRSSSIDNFVGCVGHSSYFSELAVLALRFDIFDSEVDSLSLSPAMIKLVNEIRFAGTIADLASGQSDEKLLSQLAPLDASSFAALKTEKVVALVMNCTGETVDLNFHFRRYLLPLLKDRLYENDDDVFAARVDEYLSLFCLKLCQKSTNFEDILSTTKVCANLCQASMTSQKKSNRIIRNKQVLVMLVINVIKKLLESCRAVSMPDSAFRAVIDQFWVMYESLPMSIPSLFDDDYDLTASLKKADLLLKDLTLLDICSGWLGSKTASLPLQMDDRVGKDLILRSGNRIIRDLCSSFCGQLQKDVSEMSELEQILRVTKVLLDDIRACNRQCFDNSLSLKQLLSKHLVGPLLSSHQIGALGTFLSAAGPDLIDENAISSQVLDVFNEGFHGTVSVDAQQSRASAMACQDILGEWLPELRVKFQALRRYLDASHLISTMLESEEVDQFSAGNLQSQNPLDVVDLLLEIAPDCFVSHCRQWSDPDWAKDANESIRRHLNTQTSRHVSAPLSGQGNLPPLPGQPVFELAKILRLTDNASVIAVKTRIVAHGVRSKLFGASAAVCRTLAADVAASKADSLPLLDAVSKLVGFDEFDDEATKAELCSIALVLRDESLTVQKSTLLSLILASWNKLQHRNKIGKGTPHGPAGTFFQLYLEIHKEYSADIGDLFRTLYCQLSDLVVDDTLLKALSRFSIFWCISRGTRPVKGAFDSFRYYSTDAVASLAASLLLHIHDQEIARKSLLELSEIFSQQKASAEETSGSLSDNWTTPNPHIVSSLIGRGYSQFGAMRAVAMTNSRGVNEAMQWAVTHSLEPGFDDPILLVKSVQPAFDNETARRLGEVLTTLQEVLTGSISVESIFDFLKQERVERDGHVTRENHNIQNGGPETNVGGLHAENESNEEGVSDGWDDADDIFDSDAFADPAPTPSLSKQPVIPSHPDDGLDATSKVRQSLRNWPDKEQETLPTDKEAAEETGVPSSNEKKRNSMESEATDFGSEGSPPKKGHEQTSIEAVPKDPADSARSKSLSHGKSNVSITANKSNGVLEAPVVSKTPPKLKINIPSRVEKSTATPSSKTPFKLSPKIPSPAPSSADRATLLKAGQAAFRSARASSPTRQKERERLIEEGRQLLKKTRSLSSEDPFPYSLRSRGPPPASPAAEISKSEGAASANETTNSTYSLRSRGPPPSSAQAEQKVDVALTSNTVEENDGWDDFDDLDV